MNYNQLIDHTLLAPDATKEQITKLVEEAKTYSFKSVCINPGFVSYCHELLKDSDVKVCTVIGFPLGATTTNTKAIETLEALNNGADEIDMVINISKLKDKEYDYVKKEIALLKSICKEHVLKVIIETCLLTDDEKVIACQLAKEAKADFVKTSTGFSKGGATVHDIALMRNTVGPEMGVKASGGVKTKEDMIAMVENGATRIGTSHGIDLVK